MTNFVLHRRRPVHPRSAVLRDAPLRDHVRPPPSSPPPSLFALRAHARPTTPRSVGSSVDDTGGDGPGSFSVRGSVWHLDGCGAENKLDAGGWQIFIFDGGKGREGRVRFARRGGGDGSGRARGRRGCRGR